MITFFDDSLRPELPESPDPLPELRLGAPVDAAAVGVVVIVCWTGVPLMVTTVVMVWGVGVDVVWAAAVVAAESPVVAGWLPPAAVVDVSVVLGGTCWVGFAVLVVDDELVVGSAVDLVVVSAALVVVGSCVDELLLDDSEVDDGLFSLVGVARDSRFAAVTSSFSSLAGSAAAAAQTAK